MEKHLHGRAAAHGIGWNELLNVVIKHGEEERRLQRLGNCLAQHALRDARRCLRYPPICRSAPTNITTNLQIPVSRISTYVLSIRILLAQQQEWLAN